MSPRHFAVLPVALALISCNEQGDDQVEPEPTVSPTPTGETVSILRPDVEGPVELAPAEPLVVVVPFAGGGSDLSEDALLALRDLASGSEFAGDGSITLRGHSDAGGSDAVNLRAAQARAEAVKDWLVENGAEEGRIRVISFGEQNPVAPNALPDGSPNEEGRAANRRVEVTIAPPGASDSESEDSATGEEAEETSD